MRLKRNAAITVIVGCLIAAPLHAAPESKTVSSPGEEARDEFGDVEERQSLRDRLTEREDEIRVDDPTVVTLLGRRLTLTGAFETTIDFSRRTNVGAGESASGETLWESEVEIEAFYAFSKNTFFFAQGVAGFDRSVTAPAGTLQVQSSFLERGEMWWAQRNLFGRGIHLEVGRLDFDDDRTWWWDDDLDAIRLEFAGDDMDLEIAVAREFGARSTAEDGIDPTAHRVTRIFAEASWEWVEEHAIEWYLLRSIDRSGTEAVGVLVPERREDERDGTLTWTGPRLAGAWETSEHGSFAYWVDAAIVRGRETRLELEDFADGIRLVAARRNHTVRGWATDVGLTWAAPWAWEPRLTLGLAIGSGGDATERTDRRFRQTGLHGNEAGFGGVQRFPRYGALLEPELSNLRVLTVGVGFSILRSSSIDLVAHDYRQVDVSDGLTDARLDLELTGDHEHVGSEVDLIVALEEWEAWEVELRGSAFRAGSAVLDRSSRWDYGGAVTVRFAF